MALIFEEQLKVTRTYNFGALICLENQQVIISGHKETAFCFRDTDEDDIILRITTSTSRTTYGVIYLIS